MIAVNGPALHGVIDQQAGVIPADREGRIIGEAGIDALGLGVGIHLLGPGGAGVAGAVAADDHQEHFGQLSGCHRVAGPEEAVAVAGDDALLGAEEDRALRPVAGHVGEGDVGFSRRLGRGRIEQGDELGRLGPGDGGLRPEGSVLIAGDHSEVHQKHDLAAIFNGIEVPKAPRLRRSGGHQCS